MRSIQNVSFVAQQIAIRRGKYAENRRYLWAADVGIGLAHALSLADVLGWMCTGIKQRRSWAVQETYTIGDASRH